MKLPSITIFAIAAWTCQSLSAASLMINLRSTSANAAASGDVAAPFLAWSPGHDSGAVPASETDWNNLSSAGPGSSLIYSDGTAASGVTLTFGIETTPLGTIDLGTVTGINTSALYGSGGGTSGKQSLVGDAGSIFGNGNNNNNSAAGRAGWFGGGTAGVGNAIGLRVDGLAPGEYRIFVMARNTNSNAASAPMDIYASTGTFSTTFDFTSLTSYEQANPVYPNTNPTAFNSFDQDNNFVSIDLTVAAGQSLFLASDGGAAGETRGFLNMVQIVPVPEPSSGLLGLIGLGCLLRRRRR